MIEKFQQYIPLIQGLRNPGMRSRHWTMLSERLSMNVMPKSNLTLSHCLELGLVEHVEEIARVVEVASKEYAIEQVMEQNSYRRRPGHCLYSRINSKTSCRSLTNVKTMDLLMVMVIKLIFSFRL